MSAPGRPGVLGLGEERQGRPAGVLGGGDHLPAGVLGIVVAAAVAVVAASLAPAAGDTFPLGRTHDTSHLLKKQYRKSIVR